MTGDSNLVYTLRAQQLCRCPRITPQQIHLIRLTISIQLQAVHNAQETLHHNRNSPVIHDELSYLNA